MRSGILVFVGALLFSSNAYSVSNNCCSLMYQLEFFTEKALYYQEAVNEAERSKNSKAAHVQALIREYRAQL